MQDEADELRESGNRASAWLPRFWQPLSAEELQAEEQRTAEMRELLGDGEFTRALRAFKRLGPPSVVLEAFTSDPVVLRLLVYTFHPRRRDPDTWHRLRPYVAAEREPRYLIGLQPSLLAKGVPLKWGEVVFAGFCGVDYAQRSLDRGDPRSFDEIEDEFRDQYLGRTETTPEGTVHVMTMPLVGGGGVTSRLLTRSDGSEHDEIILDIPRNAVGPDDFGEYVDQTIIRRLQQFSQSPQHRDGFFDPPPGFTRTMKLVCDGEVVLERPMHLTTNYAGMVHGFIKKYFFERQYVREGSSIRPERELSEQEVLVALFETAMIYQQDFGRVPGVLMARMQGALSSRFRDKSVSRRQNGKRRLVGVVEHSGDTMSEGSAAPHDTRSPRTTLEVVDRDGRIHLKQKGTPSWTDDALDRTTFCELLEPLTEKQRVLATLLMKGLTKAAAARVLGISQAAVSQMLDRMAPILREVLDRFK